MNDTLDIRELKQKGDELIGEVKKIINDDKAYIFVPIPSKLKMSEAQYRSLLSEPELQDMVRYSQFEDRVRPSKKKMLYTGKYVLEIEVVEGGL